jgi:F-type H+-transporting ATPase subunit alpha
VGGNAQIKAMKQVAGRLRLDLAQFRELEAFAEFGSDLDKASQAQLDRGARVVEVLKQKQYSPFTVEDQVMSIWAVTNGLLDDVPLDKVTQFEAQMLDHLRSRYSALGAEIRDSGKLEDETIEKLRSAVEEFKRGWIDREGVVETTAAEAGVPEPSATPAAQAEDAAATQPVDSATPGDEDTAAGQEGTPGE